MSYKGIENIDIEIECIICLNKVKKVVIYPYLHKFLFECLKKLFKIPIIILNVQNAEVLSIHMLRFSRMKLYLA